MNFRNKLYFIFLILIISSNSSWAYTATVDSENFKTNLDSSLQLEWQQQFLRSSTLDSAHAELIKFQPDFYFQSQTQDYKFDYNLIFNRYTPENKPESPFDYIYTKKSYLSVSYQNFLVGYGYTLTSIQKYLFEDENQLEKLSYKQLGFNYKFSENLQLAIATATKQKDYDFHRPIKYYELNLKLNRNQQAHYQFSYIYKSISEASNSQLELFNSLDQIEIKSELNENKMFATKYYIVSYDEKITSDLSYLVFAALYDQTLINQSFRGLKAFIKPTYLFDDKQNLSALIQYENPYIKQSNPQKIVLGLSYEYLWPYEIKSSLEYFNREIKSTVKSNENENEIKFKIAKEFK